MIKQFTILCTIGATALLMTSCNSTGSKERERIPVPPQGSTHRTKPWNETQRFEGEAALGPLANPRR